MARRSWQQFTTFGLRAPTHVLSSLPLTVNFSRRASGSRRKKRTRARPTTSERNTARKLEEGRRGTAREPPSHPGTPRPQLTKVVLLSNQRGALLLLAARSPAAVAGAAGSLQGLLDSFVSLVFCTATAKEAKQTNQRRRRRGREREREKSDVLLQGQQR